MIKMKYRTATLTEMDASYSSPLQVDTSSGWVSLGDEGILEAAFPTIDPEEYVSIFLLIGEAANRIDETILGIIK